MLLSGVLWPMEGMSIYLRYLSYFIPLTHAIEALRCIFARGWGIDKPEVYWGIFVNFGWIVGLLSVCLTIIRIRKYTGQLAVQDTNKVPAKCLPIFMLSGHGSVETCCQLVFCQLGKIMEKNNGRLRKQDVPVKCYTAGRQRILM